MNIKFSNGSYTEELLLGLSFGLILVDNILSVFSFLLLICYMLFSKRFNFRLRKNLLFASLLLIYLVIREFYGSNPTEGYERILRLFPIFITSLIFSCYKFNSTTSVSRILIIINFLFYFIFLIAGLYFKFIVYSHNSDPIFSDLSHYQWLIPVKIGFHPPFLGFFIVSSSVIIFMDGYLDKKFKILFSLITLVFLFFLASRMALFSFLLVQFIFLLKSGLNTKTFFLIGLGLFLFSLLIFLSPYLMEKIVNNHGITERIGLFHAALETLKVNPLFGTSLGDFYPIMRGILDENELYFENVDPHNLILYLIGSIGLVGFILFLFMLFSYRMRLNFYYYMFLGCFFILSLTETFLNRQMGVLLFSLFSGVIINKFYNKNDVDEKGINS